ncbi:MAG TPA: zf-HC2 domain-containing protein [Blastocatellia bacterium]|nr:zf-HC2 domain-containing protein [Blastocatellia bacterium]
MQRPITDETLAKYLLGELSEQEREQIERQYLADGDFFDELLAVEDDLLDEYVRGELSAGDRERFEKHLLATPRQRERLQQVKVLMERLPAIRTPPPAKKWSFFGERRLAPRLAFAFASFLLVVGAGWLIIRVAQLEREVKQMRAEQAAAHQRERELEAKLAAERKEKEELVSQMQQDRDTAVMPGPGENTNTGQQATPRMATLVLMPALVRGGEATGFKIERGVEVVQLQIHTGDGRYKSYRAELQTADGETVYSRGGLRAHPASGGQAIFLRVPENVLNKRDYVLSLSGMGEDGRFEEAGFYSFRITKN